MRCRREKLGHFICACDVQTRKSNPPIGLRPPRSSKSSQTLLWDSWLLFFDVRLRYEIGDRKDASQEMESRCRSNVWIRDYLPPNSFDLQARGYTTGALGTHQRPLRSSR